MIGVQHSKLLGMPHLLVAVPMRISVSYLQATVHLINPCISGCCCGAVSVCSRRSVLECAKPPRAPRRLWQPWLSRSALPSTCAFNFVLLPLAVINCSVPFPPLLSL